MRGIIVGTGPSLTPEAITLINNSRASTEDYLVFGCNNVYQDVDVDVHLSCNREWYDWYVPRDEWFCEAQFDKWTWDERVIKDWGGKVRNLKRCYGEWIDGLSTKPLYVSYGHSSGYQLLNLATNMYSITECVLIGYDMRFPKGYDGRTKTIGDGRRHYWEENGGEYEGPLQHWTKHNMGPDGEIGGLLKCYRTIAPEDYGIRIINCSPGTALDFFEVGDLEDWL